MSAPYPDDRNQYPGYPPAGPGYPPAGPGYPPAGPGYPPAGPGYPSAGFAPPPPMPGYGDQGYQGYPPQQPTVGFVNPGYPGQAPQGYNTPGYPQPSPYQQPPQQPDYDPTGKPLNPPYMDASDPNFKAEGFGFDDKSIRAGFIRRVYSILSIQLLCTLAFVCWMVLHEPTKRYIRSNPAILVIPMVATFVLMCVIACCEDVRRKSPANVILLGIFTLCESILVGAISSTYNAKVVIQAVGLTAAIVIALTIFAFQTKWDFTVCGGALCVILMIFTLGSIVGALFFRDEFVHFLMACAGAVVFSMYIVYDTQMMMGGDHKYSISPEEYVFASLNLYLDIIQLFLYMLRILQYLGRD